MRAVTGGQQIGEEVHPGSDRNFGLVMAAAAAIIGCLPLLRLAAPHWWLLGLSIVFGGLALVVPHVLFPLNYLWFQLGLLIHRLVSPVIIGCVFFLCVTPIGLIMRLLGNDVLSLRRRADLPSYWIVRNPPGPQPGTMTNQF
jgi:hypothetical protein